MPSQMLHLQPQVQTALFGRRAGNQGSTGPLRLQVCFPYSLEVLQLHFQHPLTGALTLLRSTAVQVVVKSILGFASR